MTTVQTLPEGWRWVGFGDVVRQVKETTKDPKSDGLTRVVGLDHLDTESLPLHRWNELDELPDGTSFTRVFCAGQVLFGKRRAYQRKVAVPEFDGVCSGDILVFEPSSQELLPEFLPYVVQSDDFFAKALNTSSGSLSPRTRWKDLASYEFLLPPGSVQAQVANVLRTLDTHVHALERSVDAAQQLYFALGASLASLATETVPLGKLLVELIDHRGKTPRKLGTAFLDAGVPVASAAAVKEGQLDLSDVRYVDHDTWIRWMSTPTQSGDILLTSEAPLGKTAMLVDDEPLVLGQRLFGLRVNETRLASCCLQAFLDSPLGQRRLLMGSSGTTVTGIRASALVKVPVPVPIRSDQQRLVERLESTRALRRELAEALAEARVARAALRERMLGAPHV